MSADEPAKPAKTDGTDWVERIWDFLTSLKLGLLATFITCSVGQNLMQEEMR